MPFQFFEDSVQRVPRAVAQQSPGLWITTRRISNKRLLHAIQVLCQHCTQRPFVALLCAAHLSTSQLQLQELRILEMIPFNKRVVQFLGSCSLDGNILLVMEFMEVTYLSGKHRLLRLCLALNKQQFLQVSIVVLKQCEACSLWKHLLQQQLLLLTLPTMDNKHYPQAAALKLHRMSLSSINTLISDILW